ncbi:MAG: HAMP domain-containing protein [Calditrichaeota bacterium]|nr:MAG: HAMP domain-containing protein [Calditrichota bacterium]
MKPTLLKKFLVVFLLVTLLPLSISSYGSIENAETELKSSLNEKYYLLTKQIINHLDENYVRRWIQNLDLLATTLAVEKEIDDAVINSLVNAFIDKSPNLLMVSLYSFHSGNPLHFVQREKIDELIEIDKPSIERLFNYNANTISKIHIGDLITLKGSKEQFLPIEIPFVWRGGERVVLRGIFSLDAAFEIIQTDFSIGQSEIYIVDGTGKIIFKNNFGKFPFGEQLKYSISDKLKQSLNGQGIAFQLESFEFEKQNYLGFFSITKLSNWGIVVVDEFSIAYALVEQMKNDIILWITFGVVLSLLFSGVFSKSLSKSISYLAEVAQEIGKGDLEVKIKSPSKDEIGQLADSLQEMVIGLKERENLLSSIRYAQRIQEAILPLKSKMKESLPEHFIIFKPKDNVSGDFYWLSQIKEKTVIAVVDCTGHGVPGAFMSMIGNTLLNHIVNERLIFDPAEILVNLHKGVRTALKQERNELDTTDGMDVCLCVIDSGEKTLSFSGAKRPLYLVENDKFIEIKGDRKSIGGLQKEVHREFTTHTKLIENDVVLYLTTDGFGDQSNPEGKKFGTKRLKEFINKISIENINTQKELVIEELANHQLEEEQRDDITVLGIKLLKGQFYAKS